MCDPLLACPFCGGKAKILSSSTGFCWAVCTNRPCRAETIPQVGAPAAIAAWNSRATPAEVDVLRARVERMEAALRGLVDAIDEHRTFERENPNNSTNAWDKLFYAVEFAENEARAALEPTPCPPDDVVEAMARAIWTTYTNSQVPPADLRGITWKQLTRWARERPKLQEIVDLCFSEARAAIRAVTARGGLVVGKMPEHWPASTGTLLDPWEKGFNAALAAVRAAAVEVEP